MICDETRPKVEQRFHFCLDQQWAPLYIGTQPTVINDSLLLSRVGSTSLYALPFPLIRVLFDVDERKQTRLFIAKDFFVPIYSTSSV